MSSIIVVAVSELQMKRPALLLLSILAWMSLSEVISLRNLCLSCKLMAKFPR
jgi:hypothetical protein